MNQIYIEREKEMFKEKCISKSRVQLHTLEERRSQKRVLSLRRRRLPLIVVCKCWLVIVLALRFYCAASFFFFWSNSFFFEVKKMQFFFWSMKCNISLSTRLLQVFFLVKGLEVSLKWAMQYFSKHPFA